MKIIDLIFDELKQFVITDKIPYKPANNINNYKQSLFITHPYDDKKTIENIIFLSDYEKYCNYIRDYGNKRFDNYFENLYFIEYDYVDVYTLDQNFNVEKFNDIVSNVRLNIKHDYKEIFIDNIEQHNSEYFSSVFTKK